MHSSSLIAALLFVAAASPAIAVPISQTKAQARAEEIDARALGLGSIVKELGLGALSGGALSALNHFIGGDSSSSRRDVSPEDLAELMEALQSESGDGDIEARKLSLGTIVKELGTGAVTSGAVAALTHFLGGGNDSKANKRALEELEARGLGSLLGKLIPSATESVSKVLKNSIVGGLASGGVLAAGEALLGNDKRELSELEARASIGPALAKLPAALRKGLAGTILGSLAGAGVEVAATTVANKPPADKAQRREFDELDARSLGSALSKILPQATDDIATVLKNSIIGGLTGGAAVAAGNAALGNKQRDVAHTLPFDSIDVDRLKEILGSTVGPAAPHVVKDKRELKDDDVVALKNIIDNLRVGGPGFATHVDARALGATGKGILGTVAGLAASSAVEPIIDGIKGLFDRDLDAALEAREPLGATGKGILGTVAGLAASSAVEPIIDGIKGLFDREVDDAPNFDRIFDRKLENGSSFALNLLASRELNELD